MADSTEGIYESLLIEETKLRFDNTFEQYPEALKYVIANKITQMAKGKREGLHPGLFTTEELEREPRRIQELYKNLCNDLWEASEDYGHLKRPDLFSRAILLLGRTTVWAETGPSAESNELLEDAQLLLSSYFGKRIDWNCKESSSDESGEEEDVLIITIDNERELDESNEACEEDSPSGITNVIPVEADKSEKSRLQ